jgi:hypothetical protein
MERRQPPALEVRAPDRVDLAGIDSDAIQACADLVGRSGARVFNIGHLNDDDDSEWFATAIYKEGAPSGPGRIDVRGAGPAEAADALSRRLLRGAECQKCHRVVVMSPVDGYCHWTRVADRWVPGCRRLVRRGTR